MWLCLLGIIPQSVRSLVRFQVRGHTWVVGLVPCRELTLETVGMDERCLHSRDSCGWTSCISLPACMSLLLLGGGIFEHLYFGSTDLQNSKAIVQNDLLAIEQKSLITPPRPTSPTYWKINIRQWAG